MEHKNRRSLSDEIVSKIRTERIAMRPRLYFTLQIAAVASISLLVLICSVFIFNFILFSIRINSHDAFLSFGPRGIEAFLLFFPWPFLALDVALIFALEWLLRTFKFGYRLPILYVLGAVVAITFATGFLLDRGTPFNDRLVERAESEHHLPPFLDELYGGVRRPPHDGICRCVITAIGSSSITVEDHHRGATTTFEVLLPHNDLHATTTGLRVGDVVLVAGDMDDGVIEAYGVRKANGGPAPHR